MTEEQLQFEYWLATVHASIGPATRRRLREQFKDAREIYRASFGELSRVPKVTEAQAHAIVSSRRTWDSDAYHLLKEKQIQLFTEQMTGFPRRLKELCGMPDILFVRGRLPKDDVPSVAVVGSRTCTAYGKSVAGQLAAKLALHGVQVLSGMAKGIDGYAHEGALSVNGTTYAVLGCGVDICYPQNNISLFSRIPLQGGLLSEYPPGTKGLPKHFPARNRIISALSDAVVVVESGKKGGSLITVDFALEQGRDVFAVPGRIGDKHSEGCNALIGQGAQILQSARQILDALQIDTQKEQKTQNRQNFFLANEEKVVYSCLDLCPVDMETLIEQTRLPAARLRSALVNLQLNGLIEEIARQQYRRRDSI